MNGIEGGNFWTGFASGAISSIIASGVQLYSDFQNMFNFLGGTGISDNTIKALQIAAGGLSGGISSSIAGGNFWAGARQGLITSGLNHVAHSIAQNSQKKQSWDSNGDGKLQKEEADDHWVEGTGDDIIVDNSKIDWTGLEIPKDKKIGDVFSISTSDAFKKLPWETAATYGGTSFERTGKSTADVLDQRYHYDLRDLNSLENLARNIGTEIGKPTYFTRVKFYN